MQATVICVVTIKDDPCGQIYRSMIKCSTDLPSDAIGECVTEAIQKAWKAGNDTVTMNISLHLS